MLSELRISDLGVIAEAVLEPGPGFTAVTNRDHVEVCGQLSGHPIERRHGTKVVVDCFSWSVDLLGPGRGR